MNRQSFMVRTGAMLGTGAFAGVMPFPLISAETSAARTSPALSDWDALRAQFNLSPGKINMACYRHASHPKPVREAIEQHRRRLDGSSGVCKSDFSCPITNAPRPMNRGDDRPIHSSEKSSVAILLSFVSSTAKKSGIC